MASIAAFLGLVVVPMALSGPTSWLGAVVHLGLTAVVLVGMLRAAVGGSPRAVVAWAGGHLLATLGFVGALEVGASVRESAYWAVPWIAVLAWAWTPGALLLALGPFASLRDRALSRAATRARRAAEAGRRGAAARAPSASDEEAATPSGALRP